MAGEPNDQQPAPESEAAAFDAETAGFAAPKVVQAAWSAERDAMIGNAQPTATEDNADEQVDGAAAAEANADALPAADAATGEADAAAEGEGGKDGDKAPQIPGWLSERVKRVSTKEREVDTGAQQLEQQRQELADREAAVTAREKAATTAKPDPDAFDDVAEYDAAKAVYDAAQLEARNAEAKVKKAAPEAKAEPKASPYPLGLTQDEMIGAIERIEKAVPESMATKLKANGVALPAAVLMELSEQPTKEGTEALARFILGNQPTIKAIAALPARSQAAALVRAFNDKPPAESKRKSGAEEPISPLGGPSINGKNLSAMAFGDFEKAINAAEAEAKAKGRPAAY